MLDATTRTFTSSTSSADPDVLAALARSLWEFGDATQRQTNQLTANRQSANHGTQLGKLASRLTQAGQATDEVSRDFSDADHRSVSSLSGMHQTIRARPTANKRKSLAPRGAKLVVGTPKVGAAAVGRRAPLRRTVKVVKKPLVAASRSTSLNASRVLSALEVRKMLRIAASQIGVKEQRNNRTKYGRWYGMNGQPWCAMFVSWVATRAGVPLPRINSNKGFAAVVSGRNFARKNNLLTMKPQAGSVFLIIGRNGKGHTGLVESVNRARRTITTIEGNTNANGSRNGDGVYRRTRKISSINGGFMLIPRPKPPVLKPRPRAK